MFNAVLNYLYLSCKTNNSINYPLNPRIFFFQRWRHFRWRAQTFQNEQLHRRFTETALSCGPFGQSSPVAPMIILTSSSRTEFKKKNNRKTVAPRPEPSASRKSALQWATIFAYYLFSITFLTANALPSSQNSFSLLPSFKRKLQSPIKW